MEINYLKIIQDQGYMYGGNQSLFGKKARHSGCGMIAACDVILCCSGKHCLDFAEYEKFVTELRDKEAYRFSLNLIGISPGKLIRILKRHLSGTEFVFLSRLKFTPESLRDLIAASISEGLPVIVRIGFNGSRLPYKICYPNSDGKFLNGRVGWHYITVTGISDSGRLIFSSWGGKGETDCEQLYRHFGITGGVITDKKFAVHNSGNKL